MPITKDNPTVTFALEGKAATIHAPPYEWHPQPVCPQPAPSG